MGLYLGRDVGPSVLWNVFADRRVAVSDLLYCGRGDLVARRSEVEVTDTDRTLPFVQ